MSFIFAEALVRVRALIPMQLHLFHQILVQHESLEAGQNEIGAWLDEAEAFLGGLVVSGDRTVLQTQLDKFRVSTMSYFYLLLYNVCRKN